ncbi:uncharacterized protein LOC135688903 [Rhopilema esculentum]|uniref:uncharacterized protein LOC135688903 n=1 Tax=Rhopilema esculentum TaxID=499914 RepID=UPI0031D776A8
MKTFIAIAIWCILEACNGQSPCLTESNNDKLCAEMQQLGSSLYDDMLDIDSNVQDAIYRSIEEGGKLLSSAVQFLKSELVNVKASTSNAPIEGASLANLKSQIETAAKAAVKTANEEILKEMKNVIGRVEQDSAFANAVATNLGFVFTSKRKRRSVSSTADLGNSVDGIVQQSLSALNDTIKKADLKMQAAFKSVLIAFTQSIKNLLSGKVQLDFDQISLNMNKMLEDAAVLLVESSLVRIKQVITQSVRHFQQIIELAKDYKSDTTKLRNILEPARTRVLDALTKTRETSDEAGLLSRIDAAVETTRKYYMEIKALVS